MEYNNRRLLTKETYSFRSYGSYPIRRLYDAYGHQRQINYWGEKTVAYAPNALGQPTQASGFASQVRWHPNGMLASFTRPGQAGSHSTTLNARQLPEQWVDTGVLHDRISYDRNGNVSQIEDLHSGLNTRSMGYDALDRLTAANGGGWGSGSYDYDALDNLRTSQLGGRSLVHSVDPVNQRLTAITGSLSLSFGYDVQGNITSRSTPSTGQGFVFDIANRMTRAVAVPGVGDLQYTYDGNGRRAWVDYPDGRYRGFAYAQDGQLLITGDSVYEGDAWHVYLGGRKVGQYSLGRGVEHIHTDQLGSAVATSSNAGLQAWTRKRYEPYGAPRPGSEVPVSSGYTGHAHDPETALVQMQQRYYEPIAGRFLSVDPVVTNAKSGSHFNRYVYAENSPYKYVDPDGRDSYLVSRPLGDKSDNPRLVHNFVVSHAKYIGDSTARVFSFGKTNDGTTGRVDDKTQGMSAGTQKRDGDFWKALSGASAKSAEMTSPIKAADDVVANTASSVKTNTVYAPIPVLFGSTNSNSAASAVADKSQGSTVKLPNAEGRSAVGEVARHRIEFGK